MLLSSVQTLTVGVSIIGVDLDLRATAGARLSTTLGGKRQRSPVPASSYA